MHLIKYVTAEMLVRINYYFCGSIQKQKKKEYNILCYTCNNSTPSDCSSCPTSL